MMVVYWNTSEEYEVMVADYVWPRIDPECNECDWIVPGTIDPSE